MFEWTVKSHQETCIFQPSSCFFCDKKIDVQNMDNHFKTECTIDWIEKNERETQGSLDLLQHWHQIDDGIQVDLNRVERSFVVILTLYLKKNHTTKLQ